MFATVLLLGMGRSGAQPQNSSDRDLFAPYHDSLINAADRVLAAPLDRSIEAPRSNSASAESSIKETTAAANVPAAAVNRVQQLRPIIERILREEQVPTDLAAIVLVESRGQSTALSPKGARGLWQFMPDTARRYGLTVSRERDERLDIGRSTRAAARYLHDLYEQFGDWQLALAAYNAGGELIRRAMAQNHTSDFSLLSDRQSLPLETRRYVPAVIDAMHRVGNATGFIAPPRNHRVAWILYADTNMATQQTEFLKETKGELK
jgi:soluble lytic murein transglycosylase-like protein